MSTLNKEQTISEIEQTKKKLALLEEHLKSIDARAEHIRGGTVWGCSSRGDKPLRLVVMASYHGYILFRLHDAGELSSYDTSIGLGSNDLLQLITENGWEYLGELKSEVIA